MVFMTWTIRTNQYNVHYSIHNIANFSLQLYLHELYRQSDRCLLAKIVSTFADRGCHVVSVTDPYGRILGFLDRSRYFFFQVAPQLYSRGWVDPVPDTLLPRKSGSASNRIRDLWICSQGLWPLDHRAATQITSTRPKRIQYSHLCWSRCTWCRSHKHAPALTVKQTNSKIFTIFGQCPRCSHLSLWRGLHVSVFMRKRGCNVIKFAI
jgi:hypothetical protein